MLLCRRAARGLSRFFFIKRADSSLYVECGTPFLWYCQNWFRKSPLPGGTKQLASHWVWQFCVYVLCCLLFWELGSINSRSCTHTFLSAFWNLTLKINHFKKRKFWLIAWATSAREICNSCYQSCLNYFVVWGRETLGKVLLYTPFCL